MKKTLGILIIIFTFFMCNSVVYGEKVSAKFSQGDIIHPSEPVYLSGYPYWYNEYKLVKEGENTKTTFAYCLEAGFDFQSEDVSWDKTTYNSNSGETLAFLYILKNSDSNQVRSIAMRMIYSYINKDYTKDIKTTDCEVKYWFNKDNEKIENTSPKFKCAIALASKYNTMHDIETSDSNLFNNYGNGKTNLASVYNTAVRIYKSSNPLNSKSAFEFVKLENDFITIRSKYGNTIYMSKDEKTGTLKNSKIGMLNALNEYYYYKIESIYISGKSINIYIPGSVSIYYKETDQDMMVVNNDESTKVEILNVIKCNDKGTTLDPTSANFNPTEYKNAGCSCTGKYNKTEFNTRKDTWTSAKFKEKKYGLNNNKTAYDALVEQYLNMCPPPCSIISTCSNLDSTCDINGIVETKVNPASMDLTTCLASSNINSIEGHELLYNANRNDINGEPIYCLEKIQLNLGTSKLTANTEGGTFGVYPYIKSTLTECATSKKTINANNSFYNILNDYKNFEKGSGYYDRVVNNSSISINDNSTTKPKTFSIIPSFEKLNKEKIEKLYEDYNDDITTLPRELLKYVAGISSVFSNISENEMLKFDFDADGKVDIDDVTISSNIVSIFIDPDPNDTININDDKPYDPTVYLYFLPKFLYTSPILGLTSLTNGKYSLGYKYALSYNLELTNNAKISDYTLNVNLYRNELTNALNSNKSTCSLKCNSDIYYSKPDNSGLYCTMPNGDKANYIDYYNKDKTKYAMCNLGDSNFDEILCQEAIGCYVGGIDYWYRPITLNDVFPNTMNDTSKKPSLKNKYRVTGANWAVKKGRETQKEIEEDGEKIYKNNTSNTTKNKMYYKITLTPQNMKEIRDYNDTQEKDGEGYADFTLDCDDKGFECTSSFLTDLLDGNYGDYPDNEFNLSNARTWTKYTNETAWK